MISKNNQKVLDDLMEKYKLTTKEKKELIAIINPIFRHKEFQDRMNDTFLHHDRITLGEHILEDSIVTYILSRKYAKDEYFNKKLAVIIAMFHDFYIEPWQNNKKRNKFSNKHGFRHPIEAAISACYHFPELFENMDEAEIIIDGIIHHMFPFPVRKIEITDDNILELNNFDQVNKIKPELLRLIIASGNRKVLGKYSFSRSIYKEGRVMSKADKIVSKLNMKESSISGIIALLTGKNKNLGK